MSKSDLKVLLEIFEKFVIDYFAISNIMLI